MLEEEQVHLLCDINSTNEQFAAKSRALCGGCNQTQPALQFSQVGALFPAPLSSSTGSGCIAAGSAPSLLQHPSC